MNAENIARVDAMVAELSALARALDVLHCELSELRAEMRGDHQTPTALPEAA